MSAAEAPICGACFGTDLSLWAEARDIEYFSVPESFSYFQCRSCGALSIFPVPENRLGAIYPSNYYSFAAQSQSFAEKIKEQLDRRIFSSLFREIGGEFMAYFDLQDPQSLADLIMRFLQSGQFPAARDVADWRWIDWHEASAQLAERTVRNAVQAPLAPARPHAHCP